MITNFIFPILRRWLWLIILVTLLTAGIGYLASQNQTITYDSDVRLLVGPGLTNSSPDLNDLRASGQLLETYASLVTTHPFLQDIVDQLHLDITANKLGNSLDVKTTAASQILDIRVTDTDPDRAMLIANTIAAHIIAISPFNPESAEFKLQDQVNKQITRIEERIAQGEDAIKQYNTLLATAATADKVSILSQISQERSRLSSSEQVLLGLYETLQKPNTNQVTVIDPAVTGKPTNPQLQLRVITGALAGIVLTLPIILAFEFFRGNVKRVEDIANVPILGSIYTYPHFKEGGANALLGYRAPEASVSEEYRKLASEILLTDDGVVPSSVLITSVGENVEIGEIAANLALVLAQVTGDVVLIDADLHHPTLSKLFKMSPRSGFSEMLHSKGDALPNTALALEGVEGLTIIPSGSRTQTPFATLAASSLESTIETLKAQHKLLVVIAPPFNQYAEGLLLAASIDNTILVVHNGSNQNDLKETLAILRAKHIRTIGAVFHRGHYSKSLNHKVQPTALPAGEKGKALVKANDS